jgi:bile acid:Na+ symporter, BASS family
MSFAAIGVLTLQASLALLVFAIGLTTAPRDAASLIHRPGLFSRSVLSMNVIMPLVALWMAAVLSLHPAVELALIATAVSPIPPFMPLKTTTAGGEESYAVSLLVGESLLAIILVPVSIWLLGDFFGQSLYVSPASVTRVVGASVLLPAAAGIGVRRYAPHVASWLAKPARLTAIVLLIVALVPLMVTLWEPMMQLVGNGHIAAFAALAVVGLGVGHSLGGPSVEDRPVLALSTSARHPAVAIAIVTATFPGQRLAPAGVLLALITASLTAIPYTAWIKRQMDARAGDVRPIVTTRRAFPPARPSAPQHRPPAELTARRRSNRPS